MKSDVYADALIALVERGVTPKHAVKSLASYLQIRSKEGMLRNLKLPLLRRGLALARKETDVLEIARESDASRAKKEVAGRWGKQAGPVVRTDESLVGGWRLVAGSTLVDNSFKKHLLRFYKQIVA